jgi:hypothetical protein
MQNANFEGRNAKTRLRSAVAGLRRGKQKILTNVPLSCVGFSADGRAA